MGGDNFQKGNGSKITIADLVKEVDNEVNAQMSEILNDREEEILSIAQRILFCGFALDDRRSSITFSHEPDFDSEAAKLGGDYKFFSSLLTIIKFAIKHKKKQIIVYSELMHRQDYDYLLTINHGYEEKELLDGELLDGMTNEEVLESISRILVDEYNDVNCKSFIKSHYPKRVFHKFWW